MIHHRLLQRVVILLEVTKSTAIGDEFETRVRQLRGELCWSVKAGRGTGSAFTADFGEKLRRNVPLKNPHLSDDERNFQGEFALYVTCAWRVDGLAEVISAWTSGGDTVDEMVAGLDRLVGRRVVSVSVKKPGWDLVLEFEGGHTLTIFCDQTNRVEEADNYSLFVKSKTYSVGTRSKLELSERALAED